MTPERSATLAAVAAIIFAALAGAWRSDQPARALELLADPMRRDGALAALRQAGAATPQPGAAARALVDLLDQPAWRLPAITALGEMGAAAAPTAVAPLLALLPQLQGIALTRALVALRRLAPEATAVQAALEAHRAHADPLVRMAAAG